MIQEYFMECSEWELHSCFYNCTKSINSHQKIENQMNTSQPASSKQAFFKSRQNSPQPQKPYEWIRQLPLIICHLPWLDKPFQPPSLIVYCLWKSNTYSPSVLPPSTPTEICSTGGKSNFPWPHVVTNKLRCIYHSRANSVPNPAPFDRSFPTNPNPDFVSCENN